MTAREIDRWRHAHHYLPHGAQQGERNTRRVIAITAIMMVVEIVAGSVYGSMALLADGWHMASHASALGITALAYWYSRERAHDERYSFGTWKVGVLGGYTSAVVLGVIAGLIAWDSIVRLWQPVPIRFDEAIVVACLGLIVNLVSAYMLRDHLDEEGHHAHHHDHNLRSAYMHVVADALTSLLAIFALLSGRYFGWGWMDPAMGIVGAVVIARWSYGLLREGARVLLDASVDRPIIDRVRSAIERDSDDVVTDLHSWQVGPRHSALIVSVASPAPRTPDEYKELLEDEIDVSHVTVEVNRSGHEPAGR